MTTVFEQFNLDTQSLPRLVESVRLACQQSENPLSTANAMIACAGGQRLDTDNPAFARLVASKLLQQTFLNTAIDQETAVEHATTYLKNFPFIADNTDHTAADLGEQPADQTAGTATQQHARQEIKRKKRGGKKGAKRAVVVKILEDNPTMTRKALISEIMTALNCSDTTASTHLYLAQKQTGIKSKTTKRGRGQAERARDIYVALKAEGKSNKEIAAAIAVEFGITEAGAATHVYNARKMLGESTKRTRKTVAVEQPAEPAADEQSDVVEPQDPAAE